MKTAKEWEVELLYCQLVWASKDVPEYGDHYALNFNADKACFISYLEMNKRLSANDGHIVIANQFSALLWEVV